MSVEQYSPNDTEAKNGQENTPRESVPTASPSR